MRRGDIVTVAVAGDFGKPRPALVIQSDEFPTSTIAVLLMSATLVDAPLLRVTVAPTPGNGLRRSSQVMIDRPMTVKRAKIGAPFGRLDDQSMLAITRLLALFLGFSN